MKNTLAFLAITLSVISASGQEEKWVFSQNIPVYTGGGEFFNAWAGGLNYPQFSSFDMDGDGYQDLVAFERDGNIFRTFLWKNGRYVYAPQYVSIFPELKNWVLLVDYDADGRKDIFSYNVLGMEVWTACGTVKEPRWEKEYFIYNTPEGKIKRDAIKTIGSSGWDINININYQDIPSIADIDGDGWADILCFGLTTALPEGITLEYFRQTAPLVFTREDYCWGGFVQSYTSNDIFLDVCRSENVNTRPPTKMMHLGSGILAMDVSGNGLKDIIMGELSFPNATVVYNTGTPTYAHMSRADAHFPSDDVPVDIENLPAFFAVDTDHDGTDELLVAPATTGSENYNSILLYKDISKTKEKHFALQSRGFLQNEMIDVGEGSRVVFVDVNRDALPDMIVSNYGYYEKGQGGYTCRVAFFKNTGTKYAPQFTLAQDDFAGLSSLKKTGLHPSFADLNADGFLDMIVGDSDGYLHFFTGKKDGTFSPNTYYMGGIDVGSSAMPALWDVDGDALVDMIVGAQDGHLRYYKNMGTRTSPSFTLVSTAWGGVDYSRYAAQGSTLCPSFYTFSGKKYMLLGTYDGCVAQYLLENENITLLNENILEGRVGKNATPSYMITGEGAQYIATGNYAGGVSLFCFSQKNNENEKKNTMTIYPNPTSDVFYIKIEEENILSWVLYDMAGRALSSGTQECADIKNLPSGIYIIRVTGISSSVYTAKIIKR